MSPGAEVTNAETLRAEQASILHLYRRVLAARRDSPALCHGTIELLKSGEGVLAYRRAADGDARTVVVNFTDQPQRADVDATWVVDLSSSGRFDGQPFAGDLEPDEAVILRPA